MQPPHLPVMAGEAVELLAPQSQGLYVDGTVGAGGHAEAVLKASSPGGVLLGLDRDPGAIAIASARLAVFGDRARLLEAGFDQLSQLAQKDSLDGILLDLGISSMQIDQAERGFAFRLDGPLDMRMGGQGKNAADLVNGQSQGQLMSLIKRLGEESFAGPIAKAIVAARAESPILTTARLAQVVENALPMAERKKRKIHPATKTFQALRLAVNDELGRLEAVLKAAPPLLKAGGRLVVISYHSLEDRIVKRTMAAWAAPCSCPPDFPVCACGKKPLVKLLTRKALPPGQKEIQANPRARSAKLRACERTEAAA